MTRIWNADEVVGEHEAVLAVKDLLRQVAEIAVPWRMDFWGDGQCGALITELQNAVWIARGSPKPAVEPRRPKPRSPISATKRVRIFARDNYRCCVCGEDDPESLTLDHMIPWSKGGSDEDYNLRTLCRPCNSRKGTK